MIEENNNLPSTCSVLWLSLPDEPEDQDAPLIAALAAGDAYTTDMHQAARFAGMGYTVKRKDQHRDGHLVETVLTADVLDLSIDRGFEMRGTLELNRPNVKGHPAARFEAGIQQGTLSPSDAPPCSESSFSE